MKTVVEWFREQEGWRREHCYACCGTGMTSDYGCGEDFYGPKECTTCNGNGMYWITPKGRHVAWPGGPFI
jgi:DnaJ-class molecular chaperone